MKTSLSSIPLLSQALRKYIRGLVHQEGDVDDILHGIYLKMSDSEHAIKHPQQNAKRVAKNIELDKHPFNQYAEIFRNSKL
ncbi:hypothetical protein ACM9HF_16885 [Colwellia sp. RE-S-Sl-9]